jgi:ubiquinone/menaquinone biosynthesis C-methylase UbiE
MTSSEYTPILDKEKEVPVYVPKEYWPTREPVGEKVLAEEVISRHAGYVEKNIKEGAVVLDYGGGRGRISRAFEKASLVVGADIHTEYFADWIGSINGIPHYTVLLDKSYKIPFPNQYFDHAIACEVLLHVQSMEVVAVVAELLRVAKELIVITWHNSGKEHFGKHGYANYHHDYATMCELYQLEMTKVEGFNRQKYFVLQHRA